MPRGVNKSQSISQQIGVRLAALPRGKAAHRNRGFTLLELMIVIFIILILASVAMPLYNYHIRKAREAVQKQNLDTINRVIEAYRLDKHASPQSLEDLVSAGYLAKLPLDPMTGKDDWATDPEDSQDAVDPQNPGIKSAHSSATDNASDGSADSSP
jgi:general secretion pathway protein G